MFILSSALATGSLIQYKQPVVNCDKCRLLLASHLFYFRLLKCSNEKN